MLTNLDIRGKPAQFGRGVMTDVADRLFGQFADRLSVILAETAAMQPDSTDPAVAGEGQASEASAVRLAPATTAAIPESELASSNESLALMWPIASSMLQRFGPLGIAVTLLAWACRRRQR